MATVTFYGQGDMTAFLSYDSEEILQATSTEIRFGIAGEYYDSFKGTGFTFSPAGAVTGGTVTQFDSYDGLGTNLQVRVTGFDASAATVAGYLDTGNSEALKTYLMGGADSIKGSAYADKLIGLGGNDTINGGDGNDTMVGGTGNDFYYVQQAGDLVSETTAGTAGGTDTVNSYLSAYTLGTNVENGTVWLTGSANLTGNALANALTGGSGNNVLNGGAGNDTINGGAGNDTMGGGTGSDVYYVKEAGDLVSETTAGAEGGTDTVSSYLSAYTLTNNVENGSVRLTGAANLTGNALANVLTGGSGDNVLNGGAGNDTMTGGAGNDTMVGGTGADVYYVQQAGDVVSETTVGAADGTDVVYSYLSAYTLATNIENGTVRLTGSVNLTGNSLDNKLTGGSGSNVLSGGSGNDTLSGEAGNDQLIGGAGNDLLWGGAGIDTFRFAHAPSASTNLDRMADFSAADDVIQLENAVFTQLATTGGLAEANFRAGAGVHALDANDFVLYDTGTGNLYYDADGNGAGVALKIGGLTGAPALSNVDIFIT